MCDSGMLDWSIHLISRGQTAFFRFSLKKNGKKRSGYARLLSTKLNFSFLRTHYTHCQGNTVACSQRNSTHSKSTLWLISTSHITPFHRWNTSIRSLGWPDPIPRRGVIACSISAPLVLQPQMLQAITPLANGNYKCLLAGVDPPNCNQVLKREYKDNCTNCLFRCFPLVRQSERQALTVNIFLNLILFLNLAALLWTIIEV